MPAYLTVDEVAELLKINPQTVRNWIDRGELPAVRVGQRRVRICQSDLDEFLAAGATAQVNARDEATPVARPQEPSGDVWARLGAALAEASTALSDEDRVELAETLNSLADIARMLAKATSER